MKTSARRHGFSSRVTRFSIATYAIDSAISGSTTRERQRDDAVDRQPERDRVRDGERGDLQQHRLQARAQQEEAEHEQDVIEPLRQDVRVAEPQVLPHDLHPRRPREALREIDHVAPVRAVDPFDRRRAVGLANLERIGIADEAVEPAQARRVARHRAASDRNMASAVRLPAAGSRLPARRDVLDRPRAHFVRVDEQHDAIGEDRTSVARGARRDRRRRCSAGTVPPAKVSSRSSSHIGSLATSSTNDPSADERERDAGAFGFVSDDGAARRKEREQRERHSP